MEINPATKIMIRLQHNLLMYFYPEYEEKDYYTVAHQIKNQIHYLSQPAEFIAQNMR